MQWGARPAEPHKLSADRGPFAWSKRFVILSCRWMGDNLVDWAHKGTRYTENTPRRMVRELGDHLLTSDVGHPPAWLRRWIPPPEASKWSPSSHHPTRGVSYNIRYRRPSEIFIWIVWSLGIWQTHRQFCCWGACQISKWHDDVNHKSRSFEASRNLTIKPLLGYWNGFLVPVICILPVNPTGHRFFTRELKIHTRVSWNIISHQMICIRFKIRTFYEILTENNTIFDLINHRSKYVVGNTGSSMFISEVFA